MSRIAIDFNRLPKALQRRSRATLAAMHRGAVRAAERYKGVLRDKTPVDTGHMRAAWKVKVAPARDGAPRRRELVTVSNDAPYAGIIEHGARPHPVSRAGWESIYQWVRRHRASFGLRKATPKELASITWAIVKKIEKEGARPRYIVRDSRHLLQQFTAAEVKRLIAQLARQKEPRWR